jgi:hypothetical protein
MTGEKVTNEWLRPMISCYSIAGHKKKIGKTRNTPAIALFDIRTYYQLNAKKKGPWHHEF